MKTNNSPIMLVIATLVLAMLACNLGASAPTGDGSKPTNGSTTEAPNAESARSALTSPNACDNPYMPIIVGATWNYNLAGPVPDTYIHSILSVEADGFTEQDVFGTGVTRQGKWSCENGNLIALNPSGGGSANVSADGTSIDFQTTALEGVTMPASINPGDNWTQSLTLEGTQTINGEAFPASNQTTQNCTAAGVESVSVPAGTFDAMRVDCQVTMNITLDMSGSPLATTITLTNTNWYAVKVGLVKTVSTGSGLDSTIELTSYLIP
ncbi:MAG: hypothetical protein IPJ47_14800 [Anaerolineales bacterium]|nr:hypothetical protein [Anaerolineales bacterium]